MIHKLKENECRVIDISDRLGNDDIDFDDLVPDVNIQDGDYQRIKELEKHRAEKIGMDSLPEEVFNQMLETCFQQGGYKGFRNALFFVTQANWGVRCSDARIIKRIDFLNEHNKFRESCLFSELKTGKPRTMYINDAISKLKLIVADKRVGSANKNGDLRRGEDSDYRKKLNIKYVNPTNKTVFTNADRFDTDGNGALDTPYSINETGINVNTATPVGYIMLPAPTISGLSEKYLLCLNYSMNDVQQPEVMQVELEGTFEAGSIYNVLVTVKSPEEISAKAILQEWDVVSTPVTPGVLE